MHEIGVVKQVQVQRSSLKIGHGSEKYYDPAPLLVVHQLRLTQKGVVGITEEGATIIDVHNEDHPTSRNHEGCNDISIGFTSHYTAMRERCGSRITEGIAGENILIATSRSFGIEELQAGLFIQSQSTGETILLTDIIIAAPCAPFSCFALQNRAPQPEQLKAMLQFLHHGRRGFYASLAPEWTETTIQAGDTVLIL